MTLPTSYENNERKSFFSDLISIKYFKNYFKKDRILMLIMTICFFILSPLITFFMYNNSYNSYGGIVDQTAIVAYNRVIYCIIAVICGVFLPLYLYGYNHSRKASIFFNSIPIKKHTLYNTHALLGLVYFLISVTVNFIFVSLIFFANSPESDLTVLHLKSYLINLIIFIAVYCAMIFVANIAGTLLSSVILYVYVNFYLCCWILIMYLAFEMICSYTTFRMTGEMFFNTSFIMYTISKLENMNILHGLLILAISAVLYFCGILLNSRLKIEKAERSMYFERFEQIFKYSMLAVVIIITGMAFYSNGGGFGYYIGSVFGGIAGLIIMNIITRKNIKESFYKFRNFVIFLLIITIASAPAVGILKFLDTFVPNINSIAYVESTSNYSSDNIYSFNCFGNFYESLNHYESALLSNKRSSRIKDKSAIEAVTVMQKIFQQSDKYTQNNYSSNYSPLSLFMGGFDYKFNNGYRLSKSIKFYNLNLYEILSSTEYKDAYYRINSSADYIKSTLYPLFDDEIMDKIYNKSANIYVNFNNELYDEKLDEYYSLGESFFNADQSAKLIETLKKDITAINADKQKFSAIYDRVLKNSGDFKEYRLRINFYSENNSAINMEITINDYFTETLRFIDENLK